MSEHAQVDEAELLRPDFDISHLEISDGKPVDGCYQERQMRLLTESLYTSWKEPVFAAFANVGLFYSADHPPVVPDVMVSLGVSFPQGLPEKRHNTYFNYVHGKAPEVAVEIISSPKEDEKLGTYAAAGVAYVVVHDPYHHRSSRTLRAFELHAGRYAEMLDPEFLPNVGLGLCLWEGSFEGIEATWLRWCDSDRAMLLTGAEAAREERGRTDEERQRAEEERHRADDERQRAERERLRAERLEARLRELGLPLDDPG